MYIPPRQCLQSFNLRCVAFQCYKKIGGVVPCLKHKCVVDGVWMVSIDQLQGHFEALTSPDLNPYLVLWNEIPMPGEFAHTVILSMIVCSFCHWLTCRIGPGYEKSPEQGPLHTHVVQGEGLLLHVSWGMIKLRSQV